MANLQLQGKTWDIPPKMTKHLKRILNAYKGPKNVEGWERLRDLCSSDTITYELMKRMKNFFDNFSGETNETPYILNGGTKVKEWVNRQLDNSRDSIESKKKSMKNTGMNNQYQKNQSLNVQSATSNPHKSELKKIMGEELNRINNLITHIENNKKLWQEQI